MAVTVPRFLRCLAALRACLDKDRREAALRPSRLSAVLVARDRFAEGLFRPRPVWPFA